ncbi:MAG: PIN domain nuclease [bacterium]|jgi:predicted nucleic acid-binding protein|nr:PIN domain nuclease [bacterium]MDT8365958.1 PIN domain nuclease [bacterium]
MILVDTSVWVDFLKGANSPHRRILHNLIKEDADISITDIILTEILQGIKNDRDFKSAKDYLLEFPIYVPRGIETYIMAAQLYRDCRKKGKTVRKTVDCIIAAVCIENGLMLLHKDADFDFIEACTTLRIYNKFGD